jgi:hypothetical protein
MLSPHSQPARHRAQPSIRLCRFTDHPTPAVPHKHVARYNPVGRPQDWQTTDSEVQSEDDFGRSVKRGTPWGEASWQRRAAKKRGLEAPLRPRERPRQGGAKAELREKK